MSGYRMFGWLLASLLLVGSLMTPHLAFGVAAEVTGPGSTRQTALQNCDWFDTDCEEEEETGAPRFEYPVDDDDDSCVGIRCDDDGFGVGSDDCRGLYCDDEDDEGAPRLERTPYPAPNECSATTNVQTRAPLGGNVRLDELDCQDDPWNGSTDGCLSFGTICDDDSYLVECSYVTAPSFGSAEGACDVPIVGQHQMENCFPMSGSFPNLGNAASNTQTFRCLENGTISDGGYSIDDVGPRGSDVVLLLCTSEPGVLGGPNEDTCEYPPRGVRYYTCELDGRFPVPMGSDGDWYLCTR